MAIDYDYELGNGWDRWQKLVLTELKRISGVQEDLTIKIDPIIVQAALTQQAFNELKQRFENDLATAEKLHEDHELRLRAVEQSGNQNKGVRKYKDWAIPLVLMLLVNVAVLYFSGVHAAPHVP